MTTDEHNRLKNEVASAALAWADCYNGENAEKLRTASKALRDYRAKSSSPAPARCEPPQGTQDGTWHIIRAIRYVADPVYALVRWVGDGWVFTESDVFGAHIDGAKMAENWRYHSVARPCLPDTRPSPVTDEQITKVWREHRFGNGVLDHHAFARDLLALAHFSPTQTITPVEPEITDDSIWQTFCATNPDTMVGWDRIVQFGRKLIRMARP